MRTRLACILSVLAFVSSSCSERRPPPDEAAASPSKDEEGTTLADVQGLVVVDDPAQVRRVLEEAAARDRREMEAILERLPTDAGRYLFAEHRAVLKRQLDAAAPRLTAIAGDPSRSWEVRLRAATYLLKLEEQAGWRTYLRALEAPDRETLEAAIRTLPQYYDVEGPLPDDLQRQLEKLTSHPSPQVHLLAITHLLRRGGEPTASYLASIRASAGGEGLAYETESALQEVIEGSGGELRSQALAEFERELKAGETFSQFAVSFYLRHAEASGIPYVRSKVEDPEHRTGEALVALGRLQAPGARALLLEALSDRRQALYAVRGLAELAKGTGDGELVHALARATLNKGGLRHHCVVAIAAIGGPDAAPAIESLLATESLPAARRETLDHISGRSLESRLRELHEIGILPAPIAPDPSDLESDRPSVQTRHALQRAGVVIGFDTETSVFPNRHDVLIERFAEKSLGRFRPEATREVWFGEGADPGPQSDLDPPPSGEGYIVEFVHDGRLYRFPCENYGDWYDVEAVAGAINRALDDSGAAERFVALHTGGQDSSFVFTRPELAREADERNLLLLASSNDEGRERGKAFEKAVLERLTSPQ